MPLSGPLSRLFTHADLWALPDSARQVEFDTDARPGVAKTLLRFSADRGDILMFVAMSPALRRAEPQRFCGRFCLTAETSNESAPAARPLGHDEPIPAEPDFPWWRPERCGSGRRYAYSTEHFDFVEVIIDDEGGQVFIRAIR